MKKLIEKYPVWTVLVLSLICLSPIMALRDFSPSNELRYLSIADEALRDGHIFAFTNHGAAYADKPPLYLWIVMLCRLLLGGHCMFVLSLFSFVPAAVITLTMDRWVYPFHSVAGKSGERMALALMLWTTGLFLGMSVFLRMDMLMVMWIVLALYSWHRDRPGLFAFYTFMALFTKGPVGLFVPPLAVVVYSISERIAARRRGAQLTGDHWNSVGRWLGWRFWALLAGLCALWFAGVYLDGGREYLSNLLVHQTVGRAVNSFHHDRPLWYYLLNVWPVMLPWCLLAVPLSLLSLRHGGSASVEASRTEKMLRVTVLSTFVMLSCFSAKLSIYLAPIFPFVIYLVPLVSGRLGWRRWMSWAVALPSALFALVGLALVGAVLFFGRIEALSDYGFARSPLVVLGGVVLAAGAVWTVVAALRRGGLRCTAPLAVAMLVAALVLSPLLPQANDYVGYANLCREIPAGETVYVRRVHRPENMDVYLGREVVKVEADAPIPGDGVLVSKKTFDDPALQGRRKIVHGDYAVWLPR